MYFSREEPLNLPEILKRVESSAKKKGPHTRPFLDRNVD
jgi:hypothetical protein